MECKTLLLRSQIFQEVSVSPFPEIVQNSLKSTPVPPDRSRSEQFLMISSRGLYFFKYSV